MKKFVSAEEYDKRKRLQQEYQREYTAKRRAELKKDKPSKISEDTR